MIIRKLKYVNLLNKGQWKTKKEIKKEQLKSLKYITKYAYKRIPLYKKKFKDANINPNYINSFDGFNKIPLLTRQEIVSHYPHSIVARQFYKGNYISSSTSGSSGKPMEIRFDTKSRDFYDALFFRSLTGVGYKPWNKMAFFHWKMIKPAVYERFGLMKKKVILMNKSTDKQINELIKINPDTIYCFSSHFSILFEKILSNSITIHPKRIILTGDHISPTISKKIESYFDCKVFEQYATTEFEIVAWNCSKNHHLHVNDDSVYMEIVKDGGVQGPNETGDIVLTGLRNIAMPLIRYKIGDLGSLADYSCNCGRGLSLLNSLEGRKDDQIILPSGRKISPSALTSFLEIGNDFFKYVSQYKIIQHNKNNFSIRIVKREQANLDEIFIENIKNRIRKFFNEDIFLKIVEVNKIPINKRGKVKVVESHYKK